MLNLIETITRIEADLAELGRQARAEMTTAENTIQAQADLIRGLQDKVAALRALNAEGI